MLSTRFLRRVLAPSLAAALATVAACGGDDDGPTEPTPSIAVGVAPATIPAVQGETKTATVTLTRTNFTGPVNLTLEGATVGATAASAVVSKFKIADGVILALQGVPEGVTATFAPATLSEGANTSTLTIVVGGAVAAGTHNLRVRAQGEGVSAVTAPLTLTVTAAPTPSIGITLDPTALSVQQGASGTSQVAITRAGGFAGAVNLAPSGAPEGVTVTIDPASAPAAAATVTVTVGAAVPVGDYPIIITGTGEGVENATATLTLTVTAAAPVGNYTLAVEPNPVNVQAGGTATATVNIARTGGFAGNVGLAVSGAPAGLTVTVDPASAPGNTATLSIAAAADLAAGDYPITVTGTVAGLTDQTATFTVHVTAGGGAGSVSLAFCPDRLPLWLAVQDGDGAWTHVNVGANNTFSFALSSGRGGLAYVTRRGDATSDSYDLSVFYATAAEFNASGSAEAGAAVCDDDVVVVDGKTVNGSVVNVSAEQKATISLGSASTTVFDLDLPGNTFPNFQLENVPEGPLDLIATRSPLAEFTVDKIIIRRDLNVPEGGTLDPLDFESSEAFEPEQADLTINNIGAEEAFALVSYGSASTFFGSTILFLSPASDEATRTYFGIPAEQQAADELHTLMVAASPAVENPDRGRFAIQYFRSATARSFTLGPNLSAPDITTLGTTPYLRLRAVIARQAEYDQLADISYSQGAFGTAGSRTASVSMTAGYAGAAAFDLAIPDLSGVEGFDANWGLKAGVATSWEASAVGGSFLFGFLGQRPTDGTTIQFASREGTVGGTLRSMRVMPAQSTIPGMRAMQSMRTMMQAMPRR